MNEIMTIEAGCVMILGFIFLPCIMYFVNKYFPGRNLIQLLCIAMLIFVVVHLTLQKLFVRD